MNKRILFALLALIMLLTSSCSLAKPEETTTTQIPDRLVGVFVTTEYLDLVDTDAWLNENIGDILNGEDVAYPGEGSAQPRIYAELVEETIPGASRIAHRYAFTGLEGILLAEYTISVDNGDTESYRTLDSLGQIYDIQRMNSANTFELTGSIYLCSNTAANTVFYFNPIYQSADGKVYLVPGDGMQAGPADSAYAITDTATTTENGQSQTFSSKIEIKLECVEIAKKVVLVQMDKNNKEIGRAEFAPDQMPEEFAPMDGAEYLIIESHYENSVSRSIHQRGCKDIKTFYAPDGSICAVAQTNVKW